MIDFSFRYIAVLLIIQFLSIFKIAYAAPDVVAQNYAAARSNGVQSCTVGYDLLSGDISYQQQLISSKLPYSLNYKAPLRLNLSSVQEFAQPESSTLGWSDNYQSSIMIQKISSTTTEYKDFRFYYKTSSSSYYTLETFNPIITSFSAKIIFIRLPGEVTSQIFKEQNGEFQRHYSADPFQELNKIAIKDLEWTSSLGEYSLSWSGENLIVIKNGTKYTITSNSHVIAPSATYNDTINIYLDANFKKQETRDSWVNSSAKSTNTATARSTSTTSSINIHRVASIESKGRSLKMQYDGRMNLEQVTDPYNNKLVLEHNFHETSAGTTQTVDESRLVTKVTYTSAGQTTSQVAEFKYQSYDVKTPSTGIIRKVYALIESNATSTGKISFINESTELGAVKALVASKKRTVDSSYNYPILKQVKNSLDQVVRQWDVVQNYVLGTDGTYSTAQTTLRSFTPTTSDAAYDNTSVYNDIDRSITTSIVLGSSTASNTTQSALDASNNDKLKISTSGYPCLTAGGKPIGSAEFNIKYGQLANFTDANNAITAFSYNDKNRLSGIFESRTSVSSRITRYRYNSGETYEEYQNYKFDVPTQISVVTPDLNLYSIITNVVDANGNITSQTQTSSQPDSTSKVITYEYISDLKDPNYGLLASVDGPRTGTVDKISYSYDTLGNLISQSQTVNGIARTTQYLTYNTFAQPERIVYPTGLADQFTYNSDGTLSSQVTGLGGTTGTITGQTTSYTYNALKQKTSETNPDGEVTQFAYDLAGRITQTTMPNGNRVQNTYYPIGVLASQKSLTANGSIAAESYQFLDSNGRVSKTQQGSDATRQYAAFSYDNNGNLIQTTSAAGIIEKWGYDVLNRVTSHTDGAGNVDTKSYDIHDNVIISKDALNAGTDPFSYRNGSTLTKEVNSDYGTKSYSYNEADQLTQRLHGTRKCDYNNLDELGRYRVFACTASSGTTANEYQINDNYTYDQSRYGRLDKVSTGLTGYDVDTTYSYDAYDRIIQKGTINQMANKTFGRVGRSWNVGYGYSVGGKQTALTLPSSRTITYSYNAQGMLSSINLYGNPLIRNISYDGANRLTGWLWSSAGNASYNQSYNNDGTINTITNKNSASVINYSLAYGYDKDGRITQLSRNNGITDNYSYDNVDQLTNESRTIGGAATYSINYTYDQNGNRTSLSATGQHMQPAANVAYTYAGNKLASFTKDNVAQGFSYTENGELGYGTYLPTYDNGGRRKKDGTGTDYYYMNYTHKNERSSRSQPSKGAVATVQYVYDEQSHLIGEYDNIEGVKAEYIWLGDKPVVAIYSSGNTAKIYFIVTDAQNTPRRLIDSSNQAVAWSWDSTAFGLGAPTGTATFNLRFPGQYFDGASGQFYNHNRYYNPELGRYMEADPIGLEGGLNPYAYAGNNPVMNIDPSGLSYSNGSMLMMNDSALDKTWMDNLNIIDLNRAQMSFEKAASNYLNMDRNTTIIVGYSPNYSTLTYNSSTSNLMAWTVAISGGGDSTPVRGYAASSSAYLSNDGGAGIKVGTSGTLSETIGFGASLGVGIDFYKGNLNDQYRGASQTQEVCFLIVCGRYHQTTDGKSLGWGISPLTELGGGATHFFNNTELYHAPVVIKKK